MKKFVSVPLRGKYRGEYSDTELVILYRHSVSVPLRGKYRGEFLLSSITSNSEIRFPSPCGVNIVANMNNTGLELRLSGKGFRPLAG